MAAMTLTEARTKTRGEFLDDDGTRWTNTEVDSALNAAMAQTYLEYLGHGGDRFKEVISGTTSGTGTLDLSSYSPGQVHGLNLVQQARYPLDEVPADEMQYADDQARSVEVVLSRAPQVPTTTTHPLISDGSGNALANDVAFNRLFAELVCARAAQILLVKDGVGSAPLSEIENRLAGTVMVSVPRRPGSRTMPNRKKRYYSDWLKWYYDPALQQIRLHRYLWR